MIKLLFLSSHHPFQTFFCFTVWKISKVIVLWCNFKQEEEFVLEYVGVEWEMGEQEWSEEKQNI